MNGAAAHSITAGTACLSGRTGCVRSSFCGSRFAASAENTGCERRRRSSTISSRTAGTGRCLLTRIICSRCASTATTAKQRGKWRSSERKIRAESCQLWAPAPARGRASGEDPKAPVSPKRCNQPGEARFVRRRRQAPRKEKTAGRGQDRAAPFVRDFLPTEIARSDFGGGPVNQILARASELPGSGGGTGRRPGCAGSRDIQLKSSEAISAGAD